MHANIFKTILMAAASFAFVFSAHSAEAKPDTGKLARGKYLVTIMGCGDCHTPGALIGQPDFKRALAGSDVGFVIPGMGTFYGPNLTPDRKTGLGAWSAADIIKAFTWGERPDGRMLAPSMPYMNFASLTQTDAAAIAAYLKSLKPVRNKVAGPHGPSQTAPGLVMPVIPGPVYAALPTPPAPKH